MEMECHQAPNPYMAILTLYKPCKKVQILPVYVTTTTTLVFGMMSRSHSGLLQITVLNRSCSYFRLGIRWYYLPF